MHCRIHQIHTRSIKPPPYLSQPPSPPQWIGLGLSLSDPLKEGHRLYSGLRVYNPLSPLSSFPSPMPRPPCPALLFPEPKSPIQSNPVKSNMPFERASTDYWPLPPRGSNPAALHGQFPARLVIGKKCQNLSAHDGSTTRSGRPLPPPHIRRSQ